MTILSKIHKAAFGTFFSVVVIILPVVCWAQTWTESGDAGDMIATANVTSGVGPLMSINGVHVSDLDPTDMYCISIPDLLVFEAHLNCATLDNFDLWLFDDNGYGVALDNGCAFGLTKVTGQFGSSSGTYYLAVTADGNVALSSSGEIWNPAIVSGERAPDGSGGGNPLSVWIGAVSVDTMGYGVQISGAEFCEAAVPSVTTGWGAIKSFFR